MKGILTIILATSLSAISHTALAANPAVDTNKLDCGSFQAIATTRFVTTPADGYKHAITQSIRFINPSRHVSADLRLGQHTSPDPRLGRRMALDGIAHTWWCLHSRYGEDFLIVEFACENEGARSCNTGFTMPRTEWTQVYDTTGHALWPDPFTFDQPYLAHFHGLGIWPEIETSSPRDAIFAFFPVADDPTPSEGSPR